MDFNMQLSPDHSLNDYEVLSSQIEKTFVFQKEEKYQSIIIDVKLRVATILQAVQKLIQNNCPRESYHISMYNPEKNKFTTINGGNGVSYMQVPQFLLQPRIILIRYRNFREARQNSQSQKSNEQSQKEKKDRSRERNIGEAIQLVKQWRILHLSINQKSNKKIGLNEAAKMLGISKKTLDDYYYQLRLGQYYHFNFANNLHQKIGILRAYVKQFKPQRQEKTKNLRHPKKLKIIEQIETSISLQRKHSQIVQLPVVLAQPEQMSQEIDNLRQYEVLSNVSLDHSFFQGNHLEFIKDIQMESSNKFLNHFRFSLDNPNDPFLQFDNHFKKKTLDFQSNDFIEQNQ